MPTCRLPLLILLAVAAIPGRAQIPDRAPSVPEAVRVFLDCEFCDFDHLRVETPWVAFVRDRADADLHLLLTRQLTAGGGQHYTMHVLGQGPFSGRRDTLVFATEPSVTIDARRGEIDRNIQLALVPYALRTPAGRRLRVAVEKRDDDEPLIAGPDRWRSWVFEVGADASVEKEQLQSDLQFSSEFSARRITSALKVGVSADANYGRARFTLDDSEGTVVSTRENYSGGAVIVRSLAQRWGIGAEVAIGSSTFQNTRLAVRIAPAIEYSVWPYEEATRRQLVFQYSAGVSAFQYREQTIFDRVRETRPSHAFVVGYDVRQPWGSANATLEASSYLDNRSHNRLEFDTGWGLRIIRGLQLEIGGSASLIHDQLSIPKRDATPEEILLQRRALGTDYRYHGSIGLNYTFGSIFSSVVNPRFGTGPGKILR